MGPPGGPLDAWAVYNGTLYMNFRPNARDRFFANAEKNIALGNQKWISWWGKLKTGPVNTDCLADTWSQHDCAHYPQPIPPV